MPKDTLKRPGFLFLSCPDAHMLLDHIDLEASTWMPPSKGDYDRICFWASDEEPPSSFWENLALVGLFQKQRLLVVREANNWPTAVWGKIDKAISRPNPCTWPLFCLEGDSSKNNGVPAAVQKLKSYNYAVKQNWVWLSPGLVQSRMRDYILSQAKKRNLRLDRESLESLVECLPLSAGAVGSELDKLSLLSLSSNGNVNASMLSTLHWSPQANNFRCVNALLLGNEKAMWTEYAKIEDMQTNAFMLIGLIGMQLRKLWQSRSGENVQFKGLNQNLWPSVARRVGFTNLAVASGMLVDAEQAIKSGSDIEPTMETLLSSLLRIFAVRRR